MDSRLGSPLLVSFIKYVYWRKYSKPMIPESANVAIASTTTHDMSCGHLYLLREREFVNTDQSVYKIGKTRQENGKRFGGYSKDTVIELMIRVANVDASEVEAKRTFDRLFKKRTDIGSEYYEGDRMAMLMELAKFIRPIEAKIVPSVNYESRVAKLIEAFIPVYYGMKANLEAVFVEQSMRVLHIRYNINRVYDSDGSPAVKSDESRVVVNITGFMKEMRKHYGKPATAQPVTSEQYQKFVGTNNSLCQLALVIAEYSAERNKLPAAIAAHYFDFEMEHLVVIDAITFNAMRAKCHDFKAGNVKWATYPT